MKKLLILSTVIAASLVATKGYSQVYVNAHVGLRIPGARVVVAPAPVYAAPAPVYEGGYYADPAICETDFPGYAYYDYPAFNGHYRDRYYFAHYRPYFERDHRGYFYGGRFDHARWERARGGYARPGAYRDNHRGRW